MDRDLPVYGNYGLHHRRGRRISDDAKQTGSANSAFECFYVYPTVSTGPSANADGPSSRPGSRRRLPRHPRFSEVRQVWAPMYRQRTTTSLLAGLLNTPTQWLTSRNGIERPSSSCVISGMA